MGEDISKNETQIESYYLPGGPHIGSFLNFQGIIALLFRYSLLVS